MKNIVKLVLVLLVVSAFAFSQQAWKVGGNINGTNILMTGKLSVALADTATCDTTNATWPIQSAVLSNSTYLLSGRPSVRFGIVVIDTAKAGTTTTAPTIRLVLMGGISTDTSKMVTVVDTIVSATRFYGTGVRTGSMITGTASTVNVKFPYYTLKAHPSATLGTASVAATAAQIKAGKFRWFIIP